MRHCQDKCHNYPTCTNSEFPYERGYGRCQICEVYIYWEGIYCPCCSTRLRKKRRGNHINKTNWEEFNYFHALKRCIEFKFYGVVIEVETKK